MQWLPYSIRKHCIVAEEPSVDSKEFKYYLKWAKGVVTVEGGMMHLAYNMRKPFGVIIKSGAGSARWMPYGRTTDQEVIKDVDQMFQDHAMARGQDFVFSGTKGGIDFNSDKMNLQVQNNGGEIKFHLDGAMLQQLRNAPGFVPVIINILPISNLRQFLGLTDQGSASITG